MDFTSRYGDIPEYSVFKKRIRKTTYQSKNLKLDRPSLPVTEFAVDYLRELAPRELGKIDMYWASSMCHDSYVSPCTLMVALMYARRLKLNNSKYLETVPSSNLLLVSMMVASKFLVEVDDTTLEEWVKASGMEPGDLYEMEMNFLHAIEWNLFVNTDDFWLFLLQVEQRIAWRQYLSRNKNFFTYTDLQVLSQTQDGAIWNSFVKMCLDVFKVVTACTVTYAVALLTLASIPLFTKSTLLSNIENHMNSVGIVNFQSEKSYPVIPGAEESGHIDNEGLLLENNKTYVPRKFLEDNLDDKCCSTCDAKKCSKRKLDNSSAILSNNHSAILINNYSGVEDTVVNMFTSCALPAQTIPFCFL